MKAKAPRTQKGQDIPELTEEEARALMERLLWPKGALCAHCGATGDDVYKMTGESCRAGLYRCKECEKQFTVTIGTIFEDSHLPLRKWVKAFHMMCSSKKGISALQLQRNLGLGSYRTAWHMAHRIRLAMKCEPFTDLLKGVVEVDETYVGGKNIGAGHRHTYDNKTPVVSLVEQGGNKRSFVMQKVTAKNLREVVVQNVQAGSQINTDELRAYKKLRDRYTHKPVNHSKKEYVRSYKDGTKVTTNTVESSFSLLKRGVYGTFHHVSRTHLQRYVDEFDFRWNERNVMDKERTLKALEGAKGKRLSYKPLAGQEKAKDCSFDDPGVEWGNEA